MCSHGVWCLCAMDLLNVSRLDKVETGEDTGTGDTTQNVGAVTLEEGGDALVLHDLSASVECGFVVDAYVEVKYLVIYWRCDSRKRK